MDEEVARFVLSKNPIMSLDDTPYTAIGQMNTAGVLVGGCVFTNYTQRDIHGHLAGVGNWLTRRFLGECFRYIFQTLGCVRATGLVAASNIRAQQFDESLGFKYEGTLRKFLPNDEDCYVYGMLREECRWLNVGVMRNDNPRSPTAGAPHVARLTAGPGRRSGPSIARLASAHESRPDR
jgi:RimJ/RimL family protein N-acetyltransferase